MSNLLLIVGYCLLICSIASYYKAIEQIIIKNPATSNFFLLFLLFCTGYIQGAIGFYFLDFSSVIPVPLFTTGLWTFIAATYFAAPVAYLYYHSLINNDVKKQLYHLIPPFTVSIISAFYIFTRNQDYIYDMRRDFLNASHETPVILIITGAVLILVIYIARILAIELSVIKTVSIKFAIRWLIILTSGLLLSPVIHLAGFFMSSAEVLAVGSLLLIVNNLLFILAQVRYSNFFQALGEIVRLTQQRKLVLRNLDIDQLQKKIDHLMNHQKYYQNFDISIKSTATELNISPHQLSFYLNNRLNVDFRKYINRFRVEEAKDMLINNLEQNVLTIGFHVGFGSKTSFNVTFKEFTGRTPKEYRNEYFKKNPD